MQSSASSRPLVGPRLWQIRAVRDALWIVGVITVSALVVMLWGVFLPVFIGLMLAYLFDPVLTRAEKRWRIPRAVTAVILVLFFAGLAAACLHWLWPIVVEQVSTLAKKLPQYINVVATKVGIPSEELSPKLQTMFTKAEDPRALLRELMARTGQALGVVRRVVGMTTFITVTLILIPVYFFFFSWKFDKGLAQLWSFVPNSKRERTLAIVHKMDRATAGFFRGRLFICACMAAAFAGGWYFTGVPYWFLLGVLAGFMTIVPYGSVIFLPIAVGLRYVESLGTGGADFVSVVVWPSAVYIIVQLLEGVVFDTLRAE